MREPTYGFTRHGHAVHAHTRDHLSTRTRYDRFNKRAALWITAHVGTMTCAWVFCLLALSSLPAVLYAAGVIEGVGALTAEGFILVVSWVAQSFLQLVLLPSIMVGQNLQSAAADARAAKTFEDVQAVLDRLDTHTQGGLRDVMDEIQRLNPPKPKPRKRPS